MTIFDQIADQFKHGHPLDPGQIQHAFQQAGNQVEGEIRKLEDTIKGELIKFKGDIEYGINHDVIDPAKSALAKLAEDGKAAIVQAGNEFKSTANDVVISIEQGASRAAIKQIVKGMRWLVEKQFPLPSLTLSVSVVSMTWDDGVSSGDLSTLADLLDGEWQPDADGVADIVKLLTPTSASVDVSFEVFSSALSVGVSVGIAPDSIVDFVKEVAS